MALASEVGSLLIEPDRRPFSETLCESILYLRVWRPLNFGILQQLSRSILPRISVPLAKENSGNTYDLERFGILGSSDNSSTQPIGILTSSLVSSQRYYFLKSKTNL